LQHKDSLISLKDDQIAELDLARTTAEKAFASEKSELEAIIEERNSSIALLLSEKENNLSHLSVLRRDSEATIREHLSRIEATDSRVLSLLSTVVEKDEQLVAERASNAALSGERLALETQLVKQKETALASSKQIEAQNARIAELEEHIEASKASKDTIARELAQMVNQNSSLVELLHVTEASNASLEIQIANANNQKYEVDATLAEARVSIDDLHVQLQAETGALASSKSAQFDLQNQLSQSQRYAQDLRKQISTSDISVEQLRVTVESSKATNEQLSSELQSAIEHGTKLSSTLEEKEQKINELVAWKESTGKDITSWQKEVAKTKELAVALGEEVGATTVLLTSSRRETDGVRKDLEAKESQREELARMLSALETVGDDLRTEVADGKKEIHRLQLALDHAEDRVQDLQVTLRAMDEDIRATTADSDSTISVLQNTLVTAQSDIDALNNKMNTLVASYSRVRAELEEKHADLAQTQDALESAKTRVVALEQDMEELVVRAQDAEEEVLDLKSAQEADAMTIESFKEGFAKLRKMQMQSLAELDNKVGSFLYRSCGLQLNFLSPCRWCRRSHRLFTKLDDLQKHRQGHQRDIFSSPNVRTECTYI
jgi:chromosome segregation ATPase